MPDEKPKNPERYWKRERIFKQHPAVKDMPRLSDTLKERDKQGNVPLAAHEELARDKAVREGEIEGETHYGRIRRLNNEWNEEHPIFREHKVEFTPWAQLPYNERALHHVQFHIPNGGGAMSTEPHDELIVRTHQVKNDDGTVDHYTKLEQVPEGWHMVEGVGRALGESEGQIRHRLYNQGAGEGEYPKEFGGGGVEHRRQVMKEHGYNAAKIPLYENPDPFRPEKRN